MRTIFLILALLIGISVNATKWYCSPTGSDVTGNGSLAAPYYSLNFVWTIASSGDTIYLRGGTYAIDIVQNLRNKTNMKVFAYADESPVFVRGNYVENPEDYFDWLGIYTFDADGLYLKGLEVRDFPQFVHSTWGTPASFGIWCTDTDNAKFENLNIHHNGGGMMLHNCRNAIVLNSDFHHNQDPLSNDPYGGADGLVLREVTDTSSYSVVRGCRFWWNTDDGCDLWYNDGEVLLDSCWSFYNGYIPGTMNPGGDGSGFKNGRLGEDQGTKHIRTAKNLVSAYNKSGGFDNNGALCQTLYYNSLSYHNTRGMTFNEGHPVIRNVIAYANTGYNTLDDKTGWVHDHNSWNGAVTITDADFVSLDTSLLDNSRVNGYLPTISFGRLAETSDAIDAGVNVGYPYSNSAPDMGAFEYGEIDYDLPTVSTTAVSSIATTIAVSGGNVTSDGGTTVTVRGVCWNTSANPTIGSSYTSNGSGTGSYTSNITGLSANTAYHVRAYATNSGGTAYGADIQFTTLPTVAENNTVIKYRGKVVKHNNKRPIK